MGRPKALLTDPAGNAFADTAVDSLLAAGCGPVTVVLGAQADEVLALLRPRPEAECRYVVADDWAEGMGASLRAGLIALEDQPDPAAGAVEPPPAALVTLVDLPDVDEVVMGRVLDAWRADGGSADALVRATYAGNPGHPVLIGREHWAPLCASLAGDRGAQPYLSRRRVHEVSCDDLATGRDLDRPEDLT